MASAEKVVDYVSAVLSSLIPKPAEILFKPLLKPVTDNLKAWLGEKETKKSLLDAANHAEQDFQTRAKETFGNDKLTQAVVSFPLYNGELFQAALQSLPSHLNETILETHLSNDLTKYWSGEFTPEEIRAATALYIDCLRLRLLRVPGFADIITRLAILRTDSRTEDIQNIVHEILEKLSSLSNNDTTGVVFRSLHQLPQPPADFTGREALIDTLQEDFDAHKSPNILGLIGMGGIGKTVLGLVFAHRIAVDYPDAQIFLDLKGTTTPLRAAEVMRHVIRSFEPTMDVRTLEEADMSAAYQSVLHGKKVLLFLDNARSADQIKPLSPPETCAMLVTSRWSFSVAGLRSHRVNAMSRENAEKFLLELCPRIGEEAPSVAKACAYLPLALRIAGSFLQVNDVWSVARYLNRLNDRKQRLITLEHSRTEAELSTEPDLLATFDLSYQQLSEEDQKLWRMLAVFPATFGPDAVQAMWELDEGTTTKLLSSLRRYSLLDYEETSSRYDMHDLLEDYSLSQMDSEEEQKVRMKHASFYKDVLSFANDLYLQGGDRVLPGLRLLDLEWENIWAGQAWAATTRENDPALLRLCVSYPNAGNPILTIRQPPKETFQWFQIMLSAARELGDRSGEAKALGGLAAAYAALGHARTAIAFYEQDLAIARAIGDRWSEGAVLGNLGATYAPLGETHKAIEFYEQRLAIAREIGDRRGEGVVLGNLGTAYLNLGDARKAIAFYEQDLAIAREIGDQQGEASALGNLGAVYDALGETHKAIEFYEQDLAIARAIGDRRSEGVVLDHVGNAYRHVGETRKAIEFYEQNLTIAREMSDQQGEGTTLFKMGLSWSELNEKERATYLITRALAIFQTIDSPMAEKILTALRKWGTVEE